MFNNFYEKLKKNIKENYKSFLFFLVIYILLMWKVDYYIITGGGIMPVGDRIKVEDSYKTKGSFNLAYVSEVNGTVATYILSYVIPDWKRIKVSDYAYDNKESIEDIKFRGELDLLNANCYAIKNAYEKAGKDYIVTDTDLYVYFVSPDTDNKFEVGDKILEGENDIINVLVERNKKEKKLNIKLYEKEGQILTGVYINSIDFYKTNPKVKIKFKKGESGPSGGLIETLDIYNKITSKDITRGKKIAGTGEIDSEGNISTIGEVKYKLLGAVKEKADIFIVPKGENYKECIKLKKERKLKIKIIGVSTFEEAVEKLEAIK